MNLSPSSDFDTKIRFYSLQWNILKCCLLQAILLNNKEFSKNSLIEYDRTTTWRVEAEHPVSCTHKGSVRYEKTAIYFLHSFFSIYCLFLLELQHSRFGIRPRHGKYFTFNERQGSSFSQELFVYYYFACILEPLAIHIK